MCYKVCIKCTKGLEFSEFYRQIDNVCKTCKKYYANNKYKTDRQICLEYKKRYYEKNKENIKLKRKIYVKDNPEKIKLYHRENREHINKYLSDKMKIDVNFKLNRRLRTRLYNALKNNHKTGSAIKDLGCTIEELKRHLESGFQPGMTWDNYGFYGWHIDHIVPLANFNLSDREQLLKVCHYTNLQPLWAEDNLRKSDGVKVA